MLQNTKSFCSFSVDDMAKAKSFYGKTLGLDIREDKKMPGLLHLEVNGGTEIMIYTKPDHSPATFTILNFQVENLEKIVDELTAKGVKFEHYDGELKTDEKGIFRGGGPKIAWFKDPAGNILSILETK